MVYAIVLAAGDGLRMQMNCPKALIKVKNKPIFMYSLLALSKNKNVNKIFVVARKGHEQKYQKEFNKYIKNRNVQILIGDDNNRQESLKKSITQINSLVKLNKNDIILTHDCARINLTNELIDQSINTAKKQGYSTVAIKANDSLFDIKTNQYIPRKDIYLIQTPQSFQYKYWKNKDVKNSTDLFSYLGLKLNKKNIVNGTIFNFKITVEQDLNLVQKN